MEQMLSSMPDDIEKGGKISLNRQKCKELN